MRIYDSMKRQKVPFEPVTPGHVGIYLCGPTPYAPAHIGHAYSAICFDVVRRALGFLGYRVTFVRNVTDVEDKIIKASAQSGEPALELAARFTEAYNGDMARFGVLPPDVEPRVSTHIPEIIAICQRLVDAGRAYAVDGDLYFEVATFPEYGRLSGQSIADLEAGARVDVDSRKRSPHDFALWKAAKPGEPAWDAPWGRGRPGWHIECSAMCVAHLGVTFDLHGGGKDLVFPHHENEIAQSQGAYGTDSFARYWLHNGFLNFAGEKMSKSVGNVLGCAEVAAHVGGEAVRFYFVSHHYRSPIEFDVSLTGLDAADRRLAYFYATLERIDGFVAQGGDGGEGALIADADKLIAEARAAFEDDFNAPVVVAALGEAARVANRLLDEGKGLDKGMRRRSLARLARDLRAVGVALGVLASDPRSYRIERRTRLCHRHGIDPARVENLIAARAESRKAKDFARADALRAELTALGVELLDGAAGTDWRVLEPDQGRAPL